MAVSVYLLETFRFNFSDWADCITIKSQKVSINSDIKDISSEHYGELAKEFMRIAELCIDQQQFVCAAKIIGCARMCADNAIIARNVERCREERQGEEMKDYLQIISDKIANEQENKFNERQYLNGYLDALAEVRWIVQSLIEKRESEESEVEE